MLAFSQAVESRGDLEEREKEDLCSCTRGPLYVYRTTSRVVKPNVPLKSVSFRVGGSTVYRTY